MCVSKTDVTKTPSAAYFTKDGKPQDPLDATYEELIDAEVKENIKLKATRPHLEKPLGNPKLE